MFFENGTICFAVCRSIEISEDKKQVTVRLDTKEIKTILFE